jgi:type III pantothenate kinase
MLLAIDVGNSTITVGVFADGTLQRTWRLTTDEGRSVDEHGVRLIGVLSLAGITTDQIDAVVMCSVVPPVTTQLAQCVRTYLSHEPLIVAPGVKTGLTIRHDNPREVGADRIANLVAFTDRYSTPGIVVDCGTAISIDLVDTSGAFAGGVIAPGIVVSSEAMRQATARLPRVELVTPARVAGRSTVESVQAGIVFGFAGLIDGVVARLAGELGEDLAQFTVVLTGGSAPIVADALTVETVDDPWLTLHGLSLIAKRNR